MTILSKTSTKALFIGALALFTAQGFAQSDNISFADPAEAGISMDSMSFDTNIDAVAENDNTIANNVNTATETLDSMVLLKNGREINAVAILDTKVPVSTKKLNSLLNIECSEVYLKPVSTLAVENAKNKEIIDEEE
ncbi:MAG: hypothetical protein WBG71_03810 [Leeuwenhoekiella sp.]